MFFAATGSKSKMLIASRGEEISLSRLRGDHTIGSGSRDGVSAAMAARAGAAGSGLAAVNSGNLRRLVTGSSLAMEALPIIVSEMVKEKQLLDCHARA